MTPRTAWKVTIVPPRKTDGAHWQKRIMPPSNARDEHGQPYREMRESTGTTDHAEALRNAAETEADLNRTLAGGRTIIDVIDANISFRRGKGAPQSTLDSLDSVRKALLPILGAVPVGKVDEIALQIAQDEIVKTRAPSTVNGYLSLAKAAWKWGYRRGLVSHAWPNLEPLERQKTDKRALTPEECSKILSYVQTFSGGRCYPIFLFMWETGCRVSEAAAILSTDVDRETRAVSITKQRNSTKTKTEAGKRVVFVSEECLAVLSTTDPVFRSAKGGQTTRHAVNAVMDRAIAACGITGSVDLHSFRRSWVRGAERCRDVPRALAMKLTGHSSEDVYKGYDRNSIDALEELRAVSDAVRLSRGGPPALNDSSKALRDKATLSHPGTGRDRSEALSSGPVNESDPPRVSPAISGDACATPVQRVWEEFAVSETLNAVANLGKTYREALREVCADAVLRQALVRALADGWPLEVKPTGAERQFGVR